jgi:outer membrane protein assembly factor BamE (lipoprotein component of BamABCDE complex)
MRASKSIIALSLAALVVLPACSRIKSNQGYIIDESLVAAIQPGVDNKDSVARTLGRPTFASEFDTGEWYYVSRNTTQLAFIAPKAKSQSIIKVSFDAKGNVAAVNRRGLEQTASISPVGDKTATLGRNRSFFEDLFGNIGSVGAGAAPDGSTTRRDGPR